TPELLAVKVERAVKYDTIDKTDLYLDIAMPKDGGPYPCVVMFHGGAWRGGSRKDLSVGGKDKDGKLTPSVMEDVAARGYVAGAVRGRFLRPGRPEPVRGQPGGGRCLHGAGVRQGV